MTTIDLIWHPVRTHKIFCMASFSHNGVPFVKIDQLHDSINYSNGPSTQWAIQRLICKRHVFDCPYDTKIFWWFFDDKILHKFVFRRFEDFNVVNFRMIVFDRFIPSEIDSLRSYILELIIFYAQYGFVYIQHWQRSKWAHWQNLHYVSFKKWLVRQIMWSIVWNRSIQSNFDQSFIQIILWIKTFFNVMVSENAWVAKTNPKSTTCIKLV